MDGKQIYELIFPNEYSEKNVGVEKKRIINYFNLYLLEIVRKETNNLGIKNILTKIESFDFFKLKTFNEKEKIDFFLTISKKPYFLRINKKNDLLLAIFLNNILIEKDEINISITFNREEDSILDTLDVIIRDIKESLCKEKLTNVEKNIIIKSALHLESQKFGKKPKNVQEQIDKYGDSNKNSVKIEIIGLNFQTSHYHALNAIQKLFEETNYNGNIKGTYLSRYNNSFKFEGKIPRIKFTKSEYLNAYGVTKYCSSRGKMEFSGKESKIALNALYYLSTQPHLIVSIRKRKEQGKEVVDRYQTVTTLIRLNEGWEGLTPNENKSLDEYCVLESINGKHRGFVLEPCPLFVDQINTYFVLKPANMYQEIKLKFPNASKFAYTFIDWIVKEATLKKMFESNKDKHWPNKIEIGFESLAYVLRMDTYIESRNWKRIDNSLNRCIEIAISLGWLLKHESVEGKTIKRKDIFYLNKKKFVQISKEKPTTHFH